MLTCKAPVVAKNCMQSDGKDFKQAPARSAMHKSPVEIPAPDSILAKLMKGEPTMLNRIRKINKVIAFLYRSYIAPFLGLGFIFLVMETVGRKTGKKRFTPVEYHRLYENRITVVSSRGREADWVKNIKAHGNTVRLHVGFKKYEAKALFIDNVNTKQELLKSYCIKYPFFSKMLFGIDVKTDKHILDSEAFRSLADNLEFVAFESIDSPNQ